MWRRQRQGSAGERQIIGDQLGAERGQEMVSADARVMGNFMRGQCGRGGDLSP